MTVLFIFAALRYNFGADYTSYLADFKESKVHGADSHYEIEFIFGRYLVLFPKYIYFIAFTSLLWFSSLYYLFKTNVPYKYYWLLLMYLCFTEECIIHGLVAIRSALAMVVFVWSMYFVTMDRRLIALGLLISNVFIHLASFIFIPLILLNKKSRDLFTSKVFLLTIIIASVCLIFLGKNYFLVMMQTFLADNVEEMAKYNQYAQEVSGVGSLLVAFGSKFLTLIPLYYLYIGAKIETDKQFIIFYQIGILSLCVTLLLGTGMTSRILMVLNPFFIISMIRSINYLSIKHTTVAFLCVMFFSLYSLYNSMQADYNVSFKEYHSIIGVPNLP